MKNWEIANNKVRARIAELEKLQASCKKTGIGIDYWLIISDEICRQYREGTKNINRY